MSVVNVTTELFSCGLCSHDITLDRLFPKVFAVSCLNVGLPLAHFLCDLRLTDFLDRNFVQFAPYQTVHLFSRLTYYMI